MLAVSNNSAIPVEHFVTKSEVKIVSGVVQAGQREQPDEQGDGISLAVVMCWCPRRATPAAGNGRPVRLGDVHIAIRTACVRIRSEPTDGETVQSHLRQNK